jgi:hypothetical protein
MNRQTSCYTNVYLIQKSSAHFLLIWRDLANSVVLYCLSASWIVPPGGEGYIWLALAAVQIICFKFSCFIDLAAFERQNGCNNDTGVNAFANKVPETPERLHY